MKKILVIMLLVILLSGCMDYNFDEGVLGRWDQFQGSSFVFKENGDLIEYAEGNIHHHKFWFDGKELAIEWNNMFLPSRIEKYNYTLKTVGEYEYLVLQIDNVDKFIMHRLKDE